MADYFFATTGPRKTITDNICRDALYQLFGTKCLPEDLINEAVDYMKDRYRSIHCVVLHRKIEDFAKICSKYDDLQLGNQEIIINDDLQILENRIY